MVIDTCMFTGETDMLYFRLEHLRDKVDLHVIAEASQTHLGVPRQPWIPHHLPCCLAEYRDRIIYVPVDYPDPGMAPWDREHYQRDRMWDYLTMELGGDVRPDDTVVIADLDEIPSDAALKWDLDDPPYAMALRMRTFHSAVDWEYLSPELATVICQAGIISWPHATLSKIRDARYGMPVVEDGGWHFSWIGTHAERRRKLEDRSCHKDDMGTDEYNLIWNDATYLKGEHARVEVKPIDVETDDMPDYIRQRHCPPYWFRPR